MPRSFDESKRARKRAMRIALRGFQRVPNVVGETRQREPIVEMGSARLVLPRDSQHFHYLVKCAVCARESVGEVVLNTSHIRPPGLIFCDECTLESIDLTAPARSEPAQVDTARAQAVAETAEATDDAPDKGGVPASDGGTVIVGSAAQLTAAIEGAPEQDGSATGFDQARRAQQDDLNLLVGEQSRAFSRQLQEAVGQVSATIGTAFAAGLDDHHRTLASEFGTLLASELEERIQPLVSELRAATARSLPRREEELGWLPEERLKRHEEVVSQFERAFREGLEQHRQELQAAVIERLNQRYDQSVAHLGVALGDRLAEHRESVERALVGLVEQNSQAASTELRTAVAALEERTAQLIADVAIRLEDRVVRQQTASEERITTRIEYDRHWLLAEFGTVITNGLEKLAELVDKEGHSLSTELSDRLEEHRHSLERALAAGLEQDRQATSSELRATVAGLEERSAQRIADLAAILDPLAGHLADDRSRLVSELTHQFGVRVEELVNRMAERMSDLRDSEEKRLLTETVTRLAELETRVATGQQEVFEGLHRFADRAGAAGTLSISLLQVTGKRLIASLASLAAHVTDLKARMSATQQSVADLRRELSDLRSAALQGPQEASAAVASGFGFASQTPVPTGEEAVLSVAPREPPSDDSTSRTTLKTTAKRAAGGPARKTAAARGAKRAVKQGAASTKTTSRKAPAERSTVKAREPARGSPAKAAANRTAKARPTAKRTATKVPVKMSKVEERASNGSGSNRQTAKRPPPAKRPPATTVAKRSTERAAPSTKASPARAVAKQAPRIANGVVRTRLAGPLPDQR